MALQVVVFALVLAVTHSQELLKNADLEGTSNWDCYSIHCYSTGDHHSGSKAIKASNRHNFFDGPSQNVWLKENHVYSFQGWAKLVSDGGKSQYLELEAEFNLKNGQRTYESISRKDNVRTSSGWVHLSGTFVTPSNLDHVRVYFQGPTAGIEFIADGASLKEKSSQTSGGDWKSQANARIDHLRKNNINFKVTRDGSVNAGAITIETVLDKHLFPFGTAVVASIMAQNDGGSNQKYRQFIYDHFNWAVTENAMKWNDFEYTEGHPDYNKGLNAVKKLRSHGIKVRGHNLLWAVDQWVPSWLKSKSASQIRSIVDHHIHETVGKFKGLVEHWDVNNEMLHGNFYATKLHDPNFTKEVFKTVHSIDPNVKLFLNDYSVVAGGSSTNAYLAQAKDYKASGTHIGGMGVQSHFGFDQWPNPQEVLPRLDKLGQAGVPIWVTELDVQSNDASKRADYLGDALRIFFSHKAVEGILLWGFWDKHHWRGEAASLVSGDDFHINPAGQRFLDKVFGEWKTYNKHYLSKGSAFTVRGFRGNYSVYVKLNGKVIQTKHFSLGHADHNINLHIGASG